MLKRLPLPEYKYTVVITDNYTNQVTSYEVIDVDVMAAVKHAIALNFSSYNANCNKDSYFIGKAMDFIWNERLAHFANKNKFSFTYTSVPFN